MSCCAFWVFDLRKKVPLYFFFGETQPLSVLSVTIIIYVFIVVSKLNFSGCHNLWSYLTDSSKQNVCGDDIFE